MFSYNRLLFSTGVLPAIFMIPWLGGAILVEV
jgi:hypothetical protein